MGVFFSGHPVDPHFRCARDASMPPKRVLEALENNRRDAPSAVDFRHEAAEMGEGGAEIDEGWYEIYRFVLDVKGWRDWSIAYEH